jgi:hypothetical protein
MKYKKINKLKYKVLLSEVLPYELPLFFSNKSFYLLSDRYRLKIDGNDKIKMNEAKGDKEKSVQAFTQLINGTPGIPKKSFIYYVNKDGSRKGRELTLIHPFMQLKMVDFYCKYSDIILEFCQKSPYSIRYPYKRAGYIKCLERRVPKVLFNKTDYKSNEDLKHFFAYKRYQNINGFFEDYHFQRNEKKFKYLLKTDLKHCFDNICPKKLYEAIYQKSIKILEDNSFAGTFYKMMREMDISSDKTIKGILIGPEFSRLYAEMILQEIDCQIYAEMDEKYKLHIDYEFYRYVDDGFLFYNDERVRKKFEKIQQAKLRKWDLVINPKKRKKEKRPFMDNIAIAKRRLHLVVNDIFENRLNTLKGLFNFEKWDSQYDTPYEIDTPYTIMDIKTILKSNNVSLMEVSSNFLSYFQRKLSKNFDELDDILTKYKDALGEGDLDEKGLDILKRYENDTLKFSTGIIELLFYIFNNDIRISTSIKVVTILDIIVNFVKGKLFANDATSYIFSKLAQMILYEKIVDELIFILKNNEINRLNGLEITNLLLILKDIPKSHRVPQHIVSTFLGEKFKNVDSDVNFLMAFSIINIIENDNRFIEIKDMVSSWLLLRLDSKSLDLDDTECVYIISSVLVSPFLSETCKKYIERKLGDTYGGVMTNIIQAYQMSKSPFTKWESFNLSKACSKKISSEVY